MKPKILIAVSLKILFILFLGMGCLPGTKKQETFRSKATTFAPHLKGVIYRKAGADFDGVVRLNCTFFDKQGKLLLKFDASHCLLLHEQGWILSRSQKALVMQTLNRSVIWERPQFSHHDLFISPQHKKIVSVVRKKDNTDQNEIWHDGVHIYDLKGQLLFSWFSQDHWQEIQKLWPEGDRPISRQHYIDDTSKKIGIKINSAFILEDHPLRQEFPEFQDDNLVLSLNQLSLIIIVNPKTKKIVWSHRLSDDFGYGVHSVRMTPRGSFLFFDNRSIFNGQPSKVKALAQIVELDPVTKKRIWVYPRPSEAIQAIDGSAAFETPGGNILISYESNYSLVEVTRNGEIVWEWFPHILDEEGKPIETADIQAISWEEFNRFIKNTK